jgi:hypothetical protein
MNPAPPPTQTLAPSPGGRVKGRSSDIAIVIIVLLLLSEKEVFRRLVGMGFARVMSAKSVMRLVMRLHWSAGCTIRD